MDEIIELILELIFEVIMWIGENKKISKWIRYPLMIVIMLLMIGISGLCICLGIGAIKDQALGFRVLGIILILCGGVFLYTVIKSSWKYWMREKK